MVTIRDIAQAAQVSCSTVSIVLGNRSDKLKVSERTRERVLAASRELGYYRNALASQIQTGKTGVIAVVATYIDMEYVLRVFAGIVRGAQPEYSCRLYDATKLSDHIRLQLFNQVLESRPEALLVHASTPDRGKLLKMAHELKLPVGCFDRAVDDDFDVVVGSDVAMGEAAIVEYLVANGHRKIGFVGDDFKSLEYSQARFNGFEAALAKFGLKPFPGWCFDGEEASHAFQEKFFATPENRPDAVVCSSDYLALEVMTGAYEGGAKIPRDLSITGFAGLEFCGRTRPAITTVSQEFEDLGARLAKRIIARIHTPGLPPERLLVPTVIRRGGSVATR